MNKEEILEKSRREYKNPELFEKEVTKKAGFLAANIATIFASVLQIIDLASGKGPNYALFAVISSVYATIFIIKARTLKRRHETLISIVYLVATVLFSAAHFCTNFS